MQNLEVITVVARKMDRRLSSFSNRNCAKIPPDDDPAEAWGLSGKTPQAQFVQKPSRTSHSFMLAPTKSPVKTTSAAVKDFFFSSFAPSTCSVHKLGRITDIRNPQSGKKHMQKALSGLAIYKCKQ